MLESQQPAPTLGLCLSDACTDTQITVIHLPPQRTFFLPDTGLHVYVFLIILHYHPGEHKLQEGELDFHLVSLFFFFLFHSLLFPEPRTDHRILGNA